MFSDHSMLLLRSAATVVLLGAASAVFAASPAGRQPLILDTQSGISDGQSGTILQTGPLSTRRIVEAQPIATPEELPYNNGSTPPYVVAPYIQVPGGAPAPYPPPQPQPHPRPMPRSQ